MKILAHCPTGLDGIRATYGDPDGNHDFILDPEWFADNIRIFTLPQAMRLSWNPAQYIKRFQSHKDVGEVIVDAIDEVFKVVGIEKMRELGWDYWGGCFNFRNNRRTARLSTHAWGIAVDLNPHLAPMGMITCDQPAPIVDAFEKRGFLWVTGDFMHAQACSGY